MTAELYLEARASAAESIAELGQDMVLEQIAVSENLAAGTTSRTPTPHSVKGIKHPIRESFRNSGGASATDGARVRTGEEVVLIAAEGLTVRPEIGWAIYFAATTADPATRRRIVAVRPLEPADLALLYELEVVR